MKRLSYILPFFILVSFSTMTKLKNSKSILIASESKLYITGTSNVSKFKCEFNIKTLDEPIPVHYEKGENVIHFENATLTLENSCFDCGGRGINKDFYSLLKSEEHPNIFLRLKQIKKKHHDKNSIEALIEIEIAGITKSYQMDAKLTNDHNLIISGLLKLNISDFNLKAPRKMMGLVVISEDIEINFKLVVIEC